MNKNGYSYLEIIICMTLVSIIGLCLANNLKISIKKNKFAYDNHYLNIATENLINIAHSALDNNNDLSEQISNINEQESSYFYSDRFNFAIQINKISDDLSVINESSYLLNPDNEEILSINTVITFNNQFLFEHNPNKSNFLITVDLFDKNHKLLKRVFKIC